MAASPRATGGSKPLRPHAFVGHTSMPYSIHFHIQHWCVLLLLLLLQRVGRHVLILANLFHDRGATNLLQCLHATPATGARVAFALVRGGHSWRCAT